MLIKSAQHSYMFIHIYLFLDSPLQDFSIRVATSLPSTPNQFDIDAATGMDSFLNGGGGKTSTHTK